MLEYETWNGVNHVQARWDGKLKSVFDELPDYHKEKLTISDDWWVVTIDYHS